MPETPNIYNFDLDKNKADDLPLTTFFFLERGIGEGDAVCPRMPSPALSTSPPPTRYKSISSKRKRRPYE